LELIGQANLRTVGRFQERARSQAPSLRRHYPASSVLRACPPPHTAEPAPHGVLVESRDLSPLGLPVFRSISSSRHADAITPTEPLGAVAVSPSGLGLPLNSAGSASATSVFSGPARRSLAFRPAWSLDHPRRPLPKYFNEFVASFVALVASGRATDWPGGIRTHGRSPTFTAY
jgi:hypothetical protein